MTVDKDLFLYDLAIVAIMKNEASYVKEWLDYHMAAGVDHFFIYDNESPDNFKEVLQPYIDAGIVTYKFYPGTGRQIEAYTEAFKTYRFFCRYMAFIDADEFIFPQSNKSISEVIDKILKENPTAGGVEISWIMYGSNNLETADYSKGVLERFTYRAKDISDAVKTVSNPRKIYYMTTPHCPNFFMEYTSMFERDLGSTRKILINHYKLKSREEFEAKNKGFVGDVAYGQKDYYNPKQFTHENDNDVFDDSILAYRDARLNIRRRYKNTVNYEKLVTTLMKEIAPIINGNLPPNFGKDKIETFLTCRALATYLKETVLGKERGEILEKATLKAILLAIMHTRSFSDSELLLSELTNILPLNYPEVENIRQSCIQIATQMKERIRNVITDPTKFEYYREFNNFDNLLRMIQVFEYYSHK